MQNNNPDLLTEVAEYYTGKLAEHGETARGVDWNGAESQTLRFEQLCKIIDTSGRFSLNDLGCGYGALYDFLDNKYVEFDYSGFDVSENMIQTARLRDLDKSKASFVHASEPDKSANFSVASGIFNVRLGRSDKDWLSYLEATLNILDSTSSLGFAFNCLTSYSDKDKMREYLYYADPSALFDICKRRYSRNVALLHDYGLYEFTILVRKQ